MPVVIARGALGLIADWLVEYARITDVQQQIPPLPDVDLGLLEQRGQFKANNRQAASTWTVMVAGVQRAYRFLRQQPSPLLDFEPAGNLEATPGDFPAVRTLHFEPLITDQLRQAARRAGGTLNDLLCRDLLMALCRFREEVRSFSSNGWLRLAFLPTCEQRTSSPCLQATSPAWYSSLAARTNAAPQNHCFRGFTASCSK
jgi:hypothetical protein